MDIDSLYGNLLDELKSIVISEDDFERKDLRRLPSKILIPAALIKLGRRKFITKNEALHILTHPIPYFLDTEIDEGPRVYSDTDDDDSFRITDGFISGEDQSLKYDFEIDGDYLKITNASYNSSGSVCFSYMGQKPALYHIPTKTFERDLDMNYDKYGDSISTTFITALDMILSEQP